jgi:hypothetical protein
VAFTGNIINISRWGYIGEVGLGLGRFLRDFGGFAYRLRLSGVCGVTICRHGFRFAIFYRSHLGHSGGRYFFDIFDIFEGVRSRCGDAAVLCLYPHIIYKVARVSSAFRR